MNTGVAEDRFDDVVVGSSPLMLMQGIYLAQQGRTVALVDRTENLGGSWQTASLDTGDQVEIACHLIEVFPKVYELLERISGIKFVTLDVQPVRVTRGGKIIPYFNRTLMIASGARLLLGWCKTRLAALLSRRDRNAMLNFDTKLKSFARYQLSAFFQSPKMKAPENGFVDFIDGLIERATQEGVVILQHDVRTLRRNAERQWRLVGHNRVLVADQVHMTTSTSLRRTAKGYFEAKPPTYATRIALVVDVPPDNVLTSQSYVAFWKDPAIARISRIDSKGPADRPKRFLVEFHEGRFEAINSWETEVTDRLKKARILKDPLRYSIVGRVNCTHTTNVEQLPSGKIDEGVWGYYSYGNLAAGIAAWNKQGRNFMV